MSKVQGMCLKKENQQCKDSFGERCDEVAR